jgi:hypothetical protein
MDPAGPIMTTSNSLQWAQRIDLLCDRFEADWRVGRAESIEALLAQVPDAQRRPLLRELLQIELEQRVVARERLTLQAWLDRFPEDQDLVYQGFQLTEPRPAPGAERPQSRGRLLTPLFQFLIRRPDEGSPGPPGVADAED